MIFNVEWEASGRRIQFNRMMELNGPIKIFCFCFCGGHSWRMATRSANDQRFPPNVTTQFKSKVPEEREKKIEGKEAAKNGLNGIIVINRFIFRLMWSVHTPHTKLFIKTETATKWCVSFGFGSSACCTYRVWACICHCCVDDYVNWSTSDTHTHTFCGILLCLIAIDMTDTIVHTTNTHINRSNVNCPSGIFNLLVIKKTR